MLVTSLLALALLLLAGLGLARVEKTAAPLKQGLDGALRLGGVVLYGSMVDRSSGSSTARLKSNPSPSPSIRPHPTPSIHLNPTQPAPAAQVRLSEAGPDEKLGVCYDPRHNAAYPRNPRQAFAEVCRWVGVGFVGILSGFVGRGSVGGRGYVGVLLRGGEAPHVCRLLYIVTPSS